MKNLILCFTMTAMSLFMLLSCKEEQSFSPAVSNSKTAQSSRLSAEARAKLKQLRASLPAGHEKRFDESVARLAKTHPEYAASIKRAMKVVQPTECGPTSFDTWLDGELADWDAELFFYAIITGMLDFPTYDALLFENSSDNQYFGIHGEYSQATVKGFKDLQRFWDIQSDGIVLAAMHGNMLLDRERVIRIDKILYGDSQQVAEQYADLIISLLDIVPQYRRGDHPIFTLNAFAQSSFNFSPYGIIPAKIIMGDGIIDAYNDLGYVDVASQAVLAHEFGHHIQFQLDLFGDEYTAEATRRTELMADAYAAYYLSHARGAAMQWKRVQRFLDVFFAIGDCGFANPNHHGTPLQRMAAATWGYETADNAKKQGVVMSSQLFATMFDAKLPELVAP